MVSWSIGVRAYCGRISGRFGSRDLTIRRIIRISDDTSEKTRIILILVKPKFREDALDLVVPVSGTAA